MNKDVKLASSTGCTSCVWAGRVAVYEFLTLSAQLGALLRMREGDYLRTFAQQAYAEGYRSYGYYLRELLLRGIISPTTARTCLGL